MRFLRRATKNAPIYNRLACRDLGARVRVHCCAADLAGCGEGDGKTTPKGTHTTPLSPDDLKDSHNAAKAAMPKIQQYMEKEPSKSVALGEQPLPYVWLRLDYLKDKPLTNLMAISEKTKKAIYPVLEKQKVAYCVEVQYKKDKWEVTSFGKAANTKLLFGARDDHASKTKNPTSAYFVFSVPAMGYDFLALVPLLGEEVLIPVLDDAEAHFTKGEAIRADVVLKTLRDLSRNLNPKDGPH